MLVGYSSSSEEENQEEHQEEHQEETAPNKDASPTREEEEEGEDGCPARKKPRAEPQVTKTRLPVPGSLMSMFPDDDDPETEDSSLHGGRIRSFRHERGNWATYVYLPYHPEEEFEEVLEELFSAASDGGVDLTQQEEFHLSLSQTVVLRHHWIQPFIQSLRADLAHCKKFVCSARKLKVYCNAEKTRTFLGIEVCSGQTQLLDVVRVVDRTMTEFRLDTFYKEPSFHVSLAWCVGDMREKMDGCIQKLQCLVDEREEGPFELRLDGVELRCRTGNKTFRFPLEP
ncbi:U6 snRNA phosphodiesterase 1 [Pleuronectes platessa]|uniref:U6 snRNA phosphodiesterase 1 n=1 Tax=Pleuronectes platessa TaxID=8262 RepID=UPI00232A736D|nr:U6 snRNA phosphodiesterase 1 [Pleuronectes platessa]